MPDQNKRAHESDQPEWNTAREPRFDEIFDEDATRRIPVMPPKPVKKRSMAEHDEFQIEERDYHPIRRRRDGRIGCLGGIMYAVFVICVSVILACGGWMAARDVLALGKPDATATIQLPKDIFKQETREIKDEDGNVTGTEKVVAADIDYVAMTLKNAGIIEYKGLFKLFAKVSRADVKLDPGTYVLTTELDYRALVKNMQIGTASMVETKITFPEGWTMAQIFAKLEEEGVCSAADLYAAAQDFNFSFRFLENVETGDAARLEGFIFPNTYDFYQGEQASSVINKFLTALHSQITADMWKQVENRGTTFRDAVIVASMIEKEAGSDEERARIASVIYNRIAAGMPIGIDSTILYVHPDYTGGTSLPQYMLEEDSPYNTRINTGLPPTPICNPGIASIKAALAPVQTDYYYYALDTEAGAHRFFTNYQEFAAFVATQDYE